MFPLFCVGLSAKTHSVCHYHREKALRAITREWMLSRGKRQAPHLWTRPARDWLTWICIQWGVYPSTHSSRIGRLWGIPCFCQMILAPAHVLLSDFLAGSQFLSLFLKLLLSWSDLLSCKCCLNRSSIFEAQLGQSRALACSPKNIPISQIFWFENNLQGPKHFMGWGLLLVSVRRCLCW